MDLKAGDYIVATVSLGGPLLASGYFWKILRVEKLYNGPLTEDTKVTEVCLMDVHSNEYLNAWPLSFIDIHEKVSRETAEVLYGRAKD